MRIVVTGASGQLGAALVYEFGAAHDVTAFTRAQLDIGDDAAVAAALTRARPELIVNAAALTDVDGAEDRVVEALNSNAFGVRGLAQAAKVHGATLVHYSTDFVFDGHATTPYRETDTPNPQSVYATSKLLGEWFAKDAPLAYVLRVEGIFGTTPGAAPPKGQRRRHPELAAGERQRQGVRRSHDHSVLRHRCGARDQAVGRARRAGRACITA